MKNYVPTGPQKSAMATTIRRHADRISKTHPDMVTQGHLTDAAKQLDRGNTRGAIRHLQAAAATFTPQNLLRHGVLDDKGHIEGKQHMHEIARHILRVRDIEDTDSENEARRPPYSPPSDNSYRPGPPAGLNAPARTPTGGTDAAAARPDAAQRPGSKQFSNPVELVGPKGYIHGWIKVGEQAASKAGKAFDRAVSGSDVARGEDVRNVAGMPDWQRQNTAKLKRDMPGMLASLNKAMPGERASLKRDMPGMLASLRTDEVLHNAAHHPDPAIRHQAAQELKKRGVMGRVRNFMAQEPTNVPPEAVDRRDVLLQDFSNVELSAQTARLASTPAPRGRPGGPGLYDVKGMGHTDYLQNIVKALIKNGHPPGQAYAIARGSIRRWARGGGNVHPEVRAAAGAAEAGELARQARAKAAHGH